LGETAAVRKVLTRDKKPEFSKNLQAAMKQTDFSKTVALAVDLKAGPSQPAAGAGDLAFLGGGANVLGGLDKAEALAVQTKGGSDVRLEVTILCPDAKSAEDMKKAIDGILVLSRGKQGMPKEFDDLLDIPLKVDGNKVTASKSFKVGPLLKAYKQ